MGNIFHSEFGSSLGTDVDTSKQMACADNCGKQYPSDLLGYNACYGNCWAQAILEPQGSQPNTTQPQTTPPAWSLPPIMTQQQVACSNECNKAFTPGSPDWMQCSGKCFGVTPPGTPTPGSTPGACAAGYMGYPPYCFPLPGTVVPVPGTDKYSAPPAKEPSKASILPWVAGLAVVGVGAFVLFGMKKKKPAALQANRKRRHRRH